MNEPQVLIVEPMAPESLVEMRQIIQGITRARWKYQEQIGCQESLLRHPVDAGRVLYDVAKEIGLTSMQTIEALGADLTNELIFDRLHAAGEIGDDLEFPESPITIDVGGEGWKSLR